jgi:hypothetical protein
MFLQQDDVIDVRSDDVPTFRRHPFHHPLANRGDGFHQGDHVDADPEHFVAARPGLGLTAVWLRFRDRQH